MDNLKVKPVSFKGAYKIQGPSEVMDEICWYLQKKRKSKEACFDFLDIRMAKKSVNLSDRLLKTPNTSKIEDKNAGDLIVEHLLDLISIRKGTMKPFQATAQKENIDLFLTNNDKKLAENKIINMIEDSLANTFTKTRINERAKMLLENLSKMRKSLSSGKPITNVKPEVAQKYLELFDTPNMKMLQAEEVFEGIKKGKFNIVSGNLQK